ncbi:MAG: hypothetical protein FJX76_21310, partial [Armatimonadetes bacterium]|nr:hypothetical protein [Armatimonadota bacterium]
MVPVFTPTHASWLNQVEIWFSLLSRQALRHVTFRSKGELRERILSFKAAHTTQPAQRLGLHIVPTLSVHIHESTAASNTHNFACRPLRP